MTEINTKCITMAIYCILTVIYLFDVDIVTASRPVFCCQNDNNFLKNGNFSGNFPENTSFSIRGQILNP